MLQIARGGQTGACVCDAMSMATQSLKLDSSTPCWTQGAQHAAHLRPTSECVDHMGCVDDQYSFVYMHASIMC